MAVMRLVAGDVMMSSALEIAREKLDLTPEKLATLIMLRVNPWADVKQGEEAELRGVRHETLRSRKDARELPTLFGGVVPPVILGSSTASIR